jgi:hypothetical protein
MPTCPAFERTSKRRKGFPSETRVKRGLRFVRGGEKELVEKLGRNDPCPCGSGKRFQKMLHELGPVSTAASGMTIGGEWERVRSASPVTLTTNLLRDRLLYHLWAIKRVHNGAPEEFRDLAVRTRSTDHVTDNPCPTAHIRKQDRF